MYLDYIQERYTEKDLAPYSLEQVAENFEELMKLNGRSILKTASGFMTYEPVGDSMIVYDMFVSNKLRSKGECWKLFHLITKKAEELNKRMIIGFSEKAGKNKHLGILAMQAAGFIPVYELDNREVYMRGI